jgi:serine protease DegS
MNLNRIGRAALFLSGSVIGGLALAFVIVFLRPQLLLRPAGLVPATAPAAAVTASSNATGSAADNSGASESPPAAAPNDPSAGIAAATAPPMDSYAAAVHRAAPAVVNISTRRLVTEQIQPSVLDQLFGDLQPFYRHRMERALGSGVIVDTAGHIITNNHVIENADVILVTLADGRMTRAKVVGRDPDTDLAVLLIDLKGLPVMPLGRSDQLQVGDAVLAIGDPLGLSQTVTHGIVSATGRSQLGLATFEDFIQTDAAINAGNSGGALIDARGNLIGINTAVLNNTRGNISVEGIGFAIPVNLVRGVMQAILVQGRVIRGWIGILPEDLDDEQAQEFGLAHGGVVISNMYRNSPAVQAGVHIGDIVMTIDGRRVHNAQDALQQVAGKRPGSTVTLRLLRGRQDMNASLNVIERPSIGGGT